MKKSAPLTTFDRVDAIRARLGLSAKELCRRAGLDESTLAKAKAGGGNLSLQSLQALAPKLGVALSELLGEAAPAAATIPAAAGVPPSGDLVPLAEIHSSPLNPRKTFDPEKLDELAASIAAHGVLEPLLLRPRLDPKGGDKGGYWIVFGERRWRAASLCVQAGKVDPDFHVPVVIRDMTDAEHLVIALVENGQREDVPPLEEAEGYAALQQLDPAKWSAAEIARSVGKSPRHVQIRLSLLTRLDQTTLAGMKTGKITLAQARELMLVSKADQQHLAKQIVRGESMTAEQVREDLLSDMIPAANALFDIEKSGLETYVDPDDKKKTRYVTDRAAFEKLQKAAIKDLAAKLGKEWKWVEVKEGYFSSYYYGGASKDKTKAGVVIEVGHRGAVKVHKGIIARGERSGVSSGGGRTDYTKLERARRAREKAGAAMAQALAARVKGDWPNLLRLFILSEIAGYNSGVPDISPALSRERLTGPLKGLLPEVHTVNGGNVKLRDWNQLDAASAWAALSAAPETLLQETLHDMLLRGLGCETGKAGTWRIAEALGVQLDPKDDEAWRLSLKGKIKGITKRQLDIEDAARAAKAQGRDVEDAARRAKKKAAE